MTNPVVDALAHIVAIHPQVTQVHFDVEGKWDFQDANGVSIVFNDQEDIDLLQAASDSLDDLPAHFVIKKGVVHAST